MKTLVNNILVLLVLLSAVAFSQQQIQTVTNSNDWSLDGVIWSSWTDTINTTFLRNLGGGATFRFYGGTMFAAGEWGIQMNFSKTFSSPLLIPDSVQISCEIEKGTNNWIGVCVYWAVYDSSVGWYFQFDNNKISSTQKKLCWDMTGMKNFGIKKISQISLIFQVATPDSTYTGADVGVHDLTVAYGKNTQLIDFGYLSTGVDEVSDQKQIPKGFALEQNYPNPFNPSTTIRYTVPQQGQVKLNVYNSLGQQVKTLVSEEKGKGSYEVVFNASNLPSGTYFYRLQTGTTVETKKMLLLK